MITMMQHPGDPVVGVAHRAARRLTMLRAVREGVRAAAVVMGLAGIASLAGMILPIAAVPAHIALAAALAAALLTTTVLALLRPVDPLTAGRLLDQRLHLEERTSTALELVASGGPSTPMRQRVVADAVDRVQAVDLGGAFPWRMPRDAWWIPALAVFLGIWSLWFHGVVIPGTPAHRTREVIRAEGGRLEQFARSLQSRTRGQRMPQTRRMTPQLRDLGARLQQERIDRAEALARIAELSRQIDQARREIDGRLDTSQRTPSREGRVPPGLFQRQALERQIRQLQELTSRLRQGPTTSSQDALQRLGAMTQPGDGNQPAQVQQQLQRAREQLQRGNVAGAGESLTEALRELEGLEAMLADEEGLKRTQQQLQRSRQTIASGGVTRGDQESAAESQSPQGRLLAPGTNRPSPEEGAEAPPPQGPHEGTAPGEGRVPDKMGESSARLQAQRPPQRVRGVQSEGPVATSEVLGAGRPGTSRVQPSAVTPAIIAQADRTMESARIPARYRILVRRYFQRLARLR